MSATASTPRSDRPRRPLPPVEQVRPGLWSIPVPLPAIPRYVLVYVFETDAGPYLVDTGWDTDEAFEALTAGLAGIGTSVDDVQGVLVTHAHFDHYGLAGRIRERSGAWVSLHPLDAAALAHYERAPHERRVAVLQAAGAPGDVVEAAARDIVRAAVRMPRPDVLMEDGDKPHVPGWDLTAVWTPGHSPGHLCFWEDRERLLLTGDHVLPDTVVVMGEVGDAGPDPLADYLDALDRLARYQPDEVLPAHEHRFHGLHHRLDTLRGHHTDRLTAVRSALRELGPATAWDVAAAVTPRRPPARLRGFALHAALVDMLAYLAALETRGLVAGERRPGRGSRWRVVD